MWLPLINPCFLVPSLPCDPPLVFTILCSSLMNRMLHT